MTFDMKDYYILVASLLLFLLTIPLFEDHAIGPGSSSAAPVLNNDGDADATNAANTTATVAVAATTTAVTGATSPTLAEQPAPPRNQCRSRRTLPPPAPAAPTPAAPAHQCFNGPWGPTLETSPPFVRFIFTYRSDGEIHRTFDGLSTLNIPIDDEERTVEDIHKFVHAQLYRHPEVKDMVDDVAKAAQTLFECAAALCRELTARRPASTSKRRDFVRRLREGPVMSLYDSYRAILGMYFDEVEDDELVRLFRRLMGWIFLVRTLQSRRVFRAFAVALLPEEEQSDVDHILYWLGSLLSGTTSEDDPISPLHTSLRDFLLDPTKSGTFSALEDKGHEKIALDCIKFEKRFRGGYMASAPPNLYLRPDIRPARVNSVVLLSPKKPWSYRECRRPGLLRSRPTDGTRIASGSWDNTIQVWDAATGQVGDPLAGHTSWVSLCCVLARRHAHRLGIRRQNHPGVGRSDGAAGSAILSRATPARSTLLRFSPDGTRIASGSDDNTIRVWDAATGQQVGDPLAGHTGSVNSVAFSPDGTCIASGSWTTTIRVWDAADGASRSVILSRATPLRSRPTATRIALGSDDNTIRTGSMAQQDPFVGSSGCFLVRQWQSSGINGSGTWMHCRTADEESRPIFDALSTHRQDR
ncbi:hypothetical protein B0H14DRAFT_3859392 [Mycena olivaceomarginata]|nr:hypothetical protein B0H14DRAFT_3859392 [Mycena olivaceomarginata]